MTVSSGTGLLSQVIGNGEGPAHAICGLTRGWRPSPLRRAHRRRWRR